MNVPKVDHLQPLACLTTSLMWRYLVRKLLRIRELPKR